MVVFFPKAVAGSLPSSNGGGGGGGGTEGKEEEECPYLKMPKFFLTLQNFE